MSGRRILKALVAGQTDAQALADLGSGFALRVLCWWMRSPAASVIIIAS